MTIGNAISFIERGMTDSALRDKLNAAITPADKDNILTTEGLIFSPHDFDEAYHNQLTLCAEAETADLLREFRQWWDLLQQLHQPTGCSGACGSCNQ